MQLLPKCKGVRKMNSRNQGWTDVLKREGSDFLAVG